MRYEHVEDRDYLIYDNAQDEQATAKELCIDHSRVANVTDHAFLGRRFRSLQAVLDACNQPWDEGVTALDQMTRELSGANLTPPVSRKRRTTFNEDDGNEVDYDRLRSGQPFWRTTTRQAMRGPTTHAIFVNLAAEASRKPRELVWRAAAAVTLATMLEEAGYRVEVWSAAANQEVWSKTGARYNLKNHRLVNLTCLKEARDPLDVCTLLNAVSGWYYRTVGFLCKCATQTYVDSGMGYRKPLEARDVAVLTSDTNYTIIQECFTYQAAVDCLRAALEHFQQ